MSVDTILVKLMNDVPKAVAAGVVDMGTGMLLGVKTVDSHPQEVLDLVAAATKDLFEGDNVTQIENTFKRVRGIKSDERYFKEIVVMSTNLVHIFARLRQHLKSHCLAGYLACGGEELDEKIAGTIRLLLQDPGTLKSVCNTPRSKIWRTTLWQTASSRIRAPFDCAIAERT